MTLIVYNINGNFLYSQATIDYLKKLTELEIDGGLNSSAEVELAKYYLLSSLYIDIKDSMDWKWDKALGEVLVGHHPVVVRCDNKGIYLGTYLFFFDYSTKTGQYDVAVCEAGAS